MAAGGGSGGGGGGGGSGGGGGGGVGEGPKADAEVAKGRSVSNGAQQKESVFLRLSNRIKVRARHGHTISFTTVNGIAATSATAWESFKSFRLLALSAAVMTFVDGELDFWCRSNDLIDDLISFTGVGAQHDAEQSVPRGGLEMGGNENCNRRLTSGPFHLVFSGTEPTLQAPDGRVAKEPQPHRQSDYFLSSS